MLNTEINKDKILSKKNFKWLIVEWIKTYSADKSFFSSKKIERSLLFINALILITAYFFYHLKTMSASDVVLITGTLFAYGSYGIYQTRKEKKDEKQV